MFYLISLLFVLIIYNSFATYETLQFQKVGSRRNLKTITIIWLVPFFGAYLAIKKTGFHADIESLKEPDKSGDIYHQNENPFD